MANDTTPKFPQVLPIHEVAQKTQIRVFKVVDPKLLSQLNAGNDRLSSYESDFYEALRIEYKIDDTKKIPGFGSVFMFVDDEKPEEGWVKVIQRNPNGETSDYLIDGRKVFAPLNDEEGKKAYDFIAQKTQELEQKVVDVAVERANLLGTSQALSAHLIFDEQIENVEEDWFILVKDPEFSSYVPDTVMQEGVFNPSRYEMAEGIYHGVGNRLGEKVEEIPYKVFQDTVEAAKKKQKGDELAEAFFKRMDENKTKTPKAP